MNRDHLRALADLAGLVRDRDLAALARTAATCRSIEAQLTSGHAALSGRAAQVAAMTTPDPALIGNADRLWRDVERQRLGALGVALANAAADREAARVAALRAVGRADVLDRLRDGRL
jgi:hypothetical protein